MERSKSTFFKRLFRQIERLPFTLNEIRWWFLHRFHPKHRYHIINTGLNPGWHDRDFLLEHMIIKIMKDFVEKELKEEEEVFDGGFEFQIRESHKKEDWIRLKELYEFFKANDFTQMDDEELTPYLIDIIKIRGIFWT